MYDEGVTLQLGDLFQGIAVTRSQDQCRTFLGMKLHLSPEGKPAPPRPLRPDFFISSMIQSGPIHMMSLVMW